MLKKIFKFKIVIITLILLIAAGLIYLNFNKAKFSVPYKTVNAGRIGLGEIVTGEKGLMMVADKETGVGVGLGVNKNGNQYMITPIFADAREGVEPIAENNRLLYEEIFDGVDVEYLLYDGKIKENIIIKNNQSQRSFVYDLKQQFPQINQIELRVDAGSFIQIYDETTGEELLSFDFPIAYDANNFPIPYHYKLLDDNQLLLEVHDKRDWEKEIAYPVVLDPPMTVREYDEVLVKIGQNGDKTGQAKDGDVIMIKPQGFKWGEKEYLKFVIVRVLKMSAEQRYKFGQKFSVTQLFYDNESDASKIYEHIDGVYYYGIDYASLIEDERVQAVEVNQELLERSTGKRGLLKIIRDAGKRNPVIDATTLSLEEIFKPKEFTQSLSKYSDEELRSNAVAVNLKLGDESVIDESNRLAGPVKEKKIFLAGWWDELIKPALALSTDTNKIGSTCDGSCDYATVAAWNTGEAGDITAAGSDTIEVAECYNDGDDTTVAVIEGWTTDATHYVKIYTPTAERHTGLQDTGYKLNQDGTTSVPLEIKSDYVWVDGLEIEAEHTNNLNILNIRTSGVANDSKISNCLIYTDGSDKAEGIRVANDVGSPDIKIWNNFLFNFQQGAIINSDTETDVFLKNNSIYNVAYGVYNSGWGKTYATSTVVLTCSDTCFKASNGSIIQAYNVSSDATASGTGSLTSKSAADNFKSTSSGSEDLHVKDTDADIYNAGVSNAGDPYHSFTDDIDGYTRPTSWDIGADEYNHVPSVSSASDSPSETNSGSDVTFSVNWADSDSGDKVKIHVCKSNSMSTTTASQACGGSGAWCDGSSFTTDDPTTCNYTTEAGDAGSNNYYAFACNDDNVCNFSGESGSFDVNVAPTISSVNDTPDPVTVGNDVTFPVDWNDSVGGENIKAKICKTDNLTNQNCDDGYWATSTSFTTDDPESLTYTTEAGDVGSNNYYAFVCDDNGLCSASTSGSFTVESSNSTPSVDSVVDSADPLDPGESISFSVNWSDDDAGENIKAKICKTDSLTNQNCDGGYWATSTDFTTDDPESVSYTTDSGDIGINDYFAFVCDDEGECSATSKSGTFTVQDSSALKSFRVTEYYLTTNDFTGATYDLTLDQDLADNYFILIRGSKAEGDTTGSYPDNDYARVYEVPDGKGELGDSGSSNVIALSRHVADYDWEGVVTVVECLGDTTASGFKLLDIVETSISASATSGTDSSGTAWSDIDDVVLFGGFHGGGVEWEENAGAAQHGNAGQTRLYPSSTNTLNWVREATTELDAVTITTFVVEWGSEWTVQRVNVSGSNNGDGCNAVGEYNTGAIDPVARDNTWVWGTGISDGYGIGDSASGAIVTLGNGVDQNSSETLVSWCGEFNHTRNFDIYTMTHNNLAVDYRFKTDGDSTETDVEVTMDDATKDYRFGWVTNGCAGGGNAHPRDRFWARYTADTTVTISRGYNGQAFPAWVEGVDFSGIGYGGNSTPEVSSVSDTPDPIGVGSKVWFSVDWSDSDAPDEMVKVLICKTDSLTDGACDDGAWAWSGVYTNRDPDVVYYETVAGDKGNTRNYYTFVCDDEGECSSSSSGSFTVANQRPDAPLSLLVEGFEIGSAINITDATPEFSAIYKDTDDEGDVSAEYCIEVDTQSDFGGTDMWISDSSSCYAGSAVGKAVSDAERSEDFTYAGDVLSVDGTTYYWRIWFWDGEERSATSTTGWFTMADQSAGWGTRLKGLIRLKGGVRLK